MAEFIGYSTSGYDHRLRVRPELSSTVLHNGPRSHLDVMRMQSGAQGLDPYYRRLVQSEEKAHPPHANHEASVVHVNDYTSTEAVAPPTPNSSSLCDLILSAANTLDIDESIANRKRKVPADIETTLKKKPPTKKSPASTNLFSVGGYPPGFDPSTLPPSRSSLKPPSKKSQTIGPARISQAQQASILAQKALKCPRVEKRLLLSMALARTSPRTPPSCYPVNGTVLTNRFHWAAFPPLDTILRKNMKRYYELSTNKCQSRVQQEFNNELAIQICREAKKYGWEFDCEAFDDRKIRDRIRCFFKTHIQNSKKRLRTMLRDPEKRANIKALAAYFHLIEENEIEHEDHNIE